MSHSMKVRGGSIPLWVNGQFLVRPNPGLEVDQASLKVDGSCNCRKACRVKSVDGGSRPPHWK